MHCSGKAVKYPTQLFRDAFVLAAHSNNKTTLRIFRSELLGTTITEGSNFARGYISTHVTSLLLSSKTQGLLHTNLVTKDQQIWDSRKASRALTAL